MKPRLFTLLSCAATGTTIMSSGKLLIVVSAVTQNGRWGGKRSFSCSPPPNYIHTHSNQNNVIDKVQEEKSRSDRRPPGVGRGRGRGREDSSKAKGIGRGLDDGAAKNTGGGRGRGGNRGGGRGR